MGSKTEFIDLCGLRTDGRRPGEIRRLHAKMGGTSRADGFAYLEMGNTKVAATVYGPHEVSMRSKALHDRAIITCEFSTASFAAGERKKSSKTDRRATEMAAVVRETFEDVVLTSVSPNSQISIYFEVLQSDGGVRSACLNAATLALIDAGVPMKDFLVSATAGFVDKHSLVDLNHLESLGGGPELCVAILPNSGTIVHLALEPKLSFDNFKGVMNAAMDGCKLIYEALNKEVKHNTQTLAEARGMTTQ